MRSSAYALERAHCDPGRSVPGVDEPVVYLRGAGPKARPRLDESCCPGDLVEAWRTVARSAILPFPKLFAPRARERRLAPQVTPKERRYPKSSGGRYWVRSSRCTDSTLALTCAFSGLTCMFDVEGRDHWRSARSKMHSDRTRIGHEMGSALARPRPIGPSTRSPARGLSPARRRATRPRPRERRR
jgi:hypothetical protein